MHFRRAFAHVVLAFAPLVAAAAAPPAPVQTVEGISEYRLDNGLQVLLVPDDSKPTTTVNLTFRVGSRHENYGETGMAHLLEQMMFKCSPRHPPVWAAPHRPRFLRSSPGSEAASSLADVRRWASASG